MDFISFRVINSTFLRNSFWRDLKGVQKVCLKYGRGSLIFLCQTSNFMYDVTHPLFPPKKSWIANVHFHLKLWQLNSGILYVHHERKLKFQIGNLIMFAQWRLLFQSCTWRSKSKKTKICKDFFKLFLCSMWIEDFEPSL